MPKKTSLLPVLLLLHGIIIYVLSILLLITKWFPYGSPTLRLREWLYRVF